jgi:hypothetical protein
MIKFFVSLLMVLFGLSPLALAQRVGVTAGLSQVSVEAESGVDITSNMSFQFGGIFYQPMTEMIEARIGALLMKENFVSTVGTTETTISLTNLNVPLTAGFRMSERFLLFAGPVLSVNADKSCEVTGGTCSASSLKVKGSDILVSLGANFQLTSELGMELSYDRMGGKPFAGTTGGQMINVNFQYVIE